MGAAIPTREPSTITAGDTVQWTRSLGDYPAGDGWVLSYAFVDTTTGDRVLSVNGSASGNDHLVVVAAEASAELQPGEYRGQGYVTLGEERYQVWQGALVVLPNYARGGVGDTRSQAKIILDFIDGCFEKLAKKQTVSGTIEGVQLQFRSMDELIRARNYWGTIYAQEVARMQGRQTRRAILSRFTIPS